MSRFTSHFTRVCQTLILGQLTLIGWRDRAIQGLCALALALLPGAAFAAGDLADMVDAVADGAKRGKTGVLTIAQFIGVILFIGALLSFKKIGTNPQITLGRCLGGLIIGALLLVIPELISRNQKQLGFNPVTVS